MSADFGNAAVSDKHSKVETPVQLKLGFQMHASTGSLRTVRR
jgi:hypothetical protein